MASASGRIPGIDLARGLAILGMFAAHLIDTAPAFRWAEPETWLAAVNGNSSILFATLAGVSLGLVTGGQSPHVGAPLGADRRRIAVRAGLIFLLGVALTVLPTPVYIILPAYGILFLVALPLLSWRPAWLLVFAVVFAVVAPAAVFAINGSAFWATGEGQLTSLLIGWHYPFVAWIAFVAAGLAVARIGFARPVSVVATGLTAGGVSLVGFGVIGRSDHPILTDEPHATGLGEMLGSGGLAIVILCACVLIGMTRASVVLWPVRAMGSMPLTAYTAQLLVWGIWASMSPDPARAMFEFRSIAMFWILTGATIVGCSLWAWLAGRGPLERVVSYISRALVPDRLEG